MTVSPTRCGNGIYIGYQMIDGTTAKEIHWPFDSRKFIKEKWRNDFVFKHIKDFRFRSLIINSRTISAIVKQKAVFGVPSHITVRPNDKNLISVNGKRFLCGREEIASEQIPE